MNVVDDLFESTKQGIREILQSDFLAKVKKFVYKDIEYKFTDDTIRGMLPNLQAINLGVVNEVTAYDVDGNEVVMTAQEYVERNQVGFHNKIAHEIEYKGLLNILETIQTFTALANFGSFDMAKEFYLEAKKEEEEVEEIVTEEEEEEEEVEEVVTEEEEEVIEE